MSLPSRNPRHAESVIYADTVTRHKSAQIPSASSGHRSPIRLIRGLSLLLNHPRKIGAQRRRVPAVVAR